MGANRCGCCDLISKEIEAIRTEAQNRTAELQAKLNEAHEALWLAYPPRVRAYYAGLSHDPDHPRPVGFQSKKDGVCGYSVSDSEGDRVRKHEAAVKAVRQAIAEHERDLAEVRCRVDGLRIALRLCRDGSSHR